ncbi:MAG: methyltransferase domain-containing protein [Pseudomonadota bacterium]
MKKRWRQHVNPLKMSCLVPREPLILPDGPRIEIDLGCGDGYFIIELAQQNPDTLYVGLDIRKEFLSVGLKSIARSELHNVLFEYCNLIVDTETLFPNGCVSRFYINFPDPWFKQRQQNRRWFSPQTLACLVTALTPDGEIFYQTDVWSSALEALSFLGGESRIFNCAGEWSFLRDNPFDAQTSRGLACEKKGRHIWRLFFKRQDCAVGNDSYD